MPINTTTGGILRRRVTGCTTIGIGVVASCKNATMGTPNEERSLLTRYGYPFEQIEHTLNACAAGNYIEIVPMDNDVVEFMV